MNIRLLLLGEIGFLELWKYFKGIIFWDLISSIKLGTATPCCTTINFTYWSLPTLKFKRLLKDTERQTRKD